MRNVKSYFPSFTLNKPLDVGSIVEVAESKNEVWVFMKEYQITNAND